MPVSLPSSITGSRSPPQSPAMSAPLSLFLSSWPPHSFGPSSIALLHDVPSRQPMAELGIPSSSISAVNGRAGRYPLLRFGLAQQPWSSGYLLHIFQITSTSFPSSSPGFFDSSSTCGLASLLPILRPGITTSAMINSRWTGWTGMVIVFRWCALKGVRVQASRGMLRGVAICGIRIGRISAGFCFAVHSRQNSGWILIVSRRVREGVPKSSSSGVEEIQFTTLPASSVPDRRRCSVLVVGSGAIGRLMTAVAGLWCSCRWVTVPSCFPFLLAGRPNAQQYVKLLSHWVSPPIPIMAHVGLQLCVFDGF